MDSGIALLSPAVSVFLLQVCGMIPVKLKLVMRLKYDAC